MRRGQRALLLAVLLLACPLAWLLARDLEPPSRGEDFLPAGVPLFLHWHGLDRFTKPLVASPLARTLGRADFPDTLRQTGLEEETVLRFTRRLELFRGLTDWLAARPGAAELFHGRGMMALLPPEEGEKVAEDHLESFRNHVVFLMPDGPGGPVAASSPDIGPLRGGRDHLGVRIAEHRADGGPSLFLCRTRGLILAAFAQKTLIRCLDQVMFRLLDGPVEPGRERLRPERPGEFYFRADIRALQEQLPWAVFLVPFLKEATPRSAVLAHRMRGRERELNMRLRFAEGELDRWRKDRGLAPPARPPLSASRDAANLFHLWTNWYTPAVGDSIAEAVGATELGAPLWAAVSNFLGQLSFTQDEFYRHFAPDLGLVIRGERNAQGSLKPLFALYFRSLDEPRVEATLKRLFRKFPLQNVKLERGSEATAIGMAGGMVQPAVAHMRGHLVLADNLHMVQRMEDHLFAGGTECAAPGLHGTGREEGAPVSFSLYLKNREVAASLSWLLRHLASAKNERGVALLDNRRKVFVHQLALPFMASVGAVDASLLSFAVSGDEARASLESRVDKADADEAAGTNRDHRR